MVSTRKKRQSNRRLLSQLDDFDQDVIIGNAASERQKGIVVNESTNDQDFTTSTSSNSLAGNGNAMNVKTLERCFNEKIDREMNNIVDTVEDRIQNAILTAIDSIIAPKTELAIRSINASSGRDLTSMSASSERREHLGIHASFENASEGNDTLGVSNVNYETRRNITDEVIEMSVPGTRFDRQPHTHHIKSQFLGPVVLFPGLHWINESTPVGVYKSFHGARLLNWFHRVTRCSVDSFVQFLSQVEPDVYSYEGNWKTLLLHVMCSSCVAPQLYWFVLSSICLHQKLRSGSIFVVGNIWGSMPLLKTHLKATIH